MSRKYVIILLIASQLENMDQWLELECFWRTRAAGKLRGECSSARRDTQGRGTLPLVRPTLHQKYSGGILEVASFIFCFCFSILLLLSLLSLSLEVKNSLIQGVENQSLNELLKAAVFNPSDTFPINYKETKPTSLSYSIFSVPDTIMKAFFIVLSYFFLQCNKVGVMLASTL